MNAVLHRSSAPLPVLRKQDVDLMPLAGHAAHDRLDERRRRIPLVTRVRRRDREDLQRTGSSTMR
jgi:hypothetical protein